MDRVSEGKLTWATMDIRQEAKQWLGGYPGIRYEETEDSIRVPVQCESGFDVELFDADGGYMVGYDGWHEEFDKAAEALECFAFGLCERCRLRVKMRGKSPQTWTLEYFEEGEWRADSTTGLLFFPFWRRAEIIYLQNHFEIDECEDR